MCILSIRCVLPDNRVAELNCSYFSLMNSSLRECVGIVSGLHQILSVQTLKSAICCFSSFGSPDSFEFHDLTVNVVEATQMRVGRLLQQTKEWRAHFLVAKPNTRPPPPKHTHTPHVMVVLASDAAVHRHRGAGAKWEQLGEFALNAGVSLSGFNPPVPRSFLPAPLRSEGLSSWIDG